MAPMTARLTLISHAATPSLRRAAFPEDETLELSEIARIEALAWTAPRAQHLLTAPEKRARETADALGLQASEDDGLRDCDYGSWRGLDLNEVEQNNPDGLMAWLTDSSAAPHHGESLGALFIRVGAWLNAQQQQAGHTIAITHPAIVRCAIVSSLGAPTSAFWRLDIAPLSLTDLRFNGRAWTVRSTACPLRPGQNEAL
jgi:broad specificity phosphatase PhoE